MTADVKIETVHCLTEKEHRLLFGHPFSVLHVTVRQQDAVVDGRPSCTELMIRYPI